MCVCDCVCVVCVCMSIYSYEGQFWFHTIIVRTFLRCKDFLGSPHKLRFKTRFMLGLSI